MTAREICDACALARVPCPGFLAHCARGEHCTAQEHVCALDVRNDDHPRTCCVCGKEVYRVA